ncbi:GNAT family N-acetyltransferase [Shouchella clausii]|uniref:GNAT family N-acetyltransferase n=1 Tax=Shouchella clausii TaxID=79880 RepID=UPI0021485282|nr:GNAT family N-acetyltransferase [Shouchella clausii]MCR1287137.1 GNAT family N-acetyltransferase [Shouchella clausii]
MIMLSSEQKKAIQSLQEKVEQADGIKLKLNWDLLEGERSLNGTEDYFYYNEKGELLGYLAVYFFGNKMECCGMVDPAARRRGIGRMLLDQAASDWQGKTKQFLLNSPTDSESGIAFMKAVGGEYAFTEKQLVCREVPIPYTKKGIRIRPAVSNDEPRIYELDAEGFHMTKDEAKALHHNNPTWVTYMIEEDNHPVGKLSISRQDQESWIYAFVLTKEKRGQGIGRAALTDIVHREVSNGKTVWLDVVCTNEAALTLYHTCGFTEVGSQTYYTLK